jgi:hypothetical protein
MPHRRLALTAAGLALSATAVALPATAGAVSVKARPGAAASAAKPYFDSRTSARRATPRSSAAARSARSALRARLGPQAVVDVDALTGTARTIQRLDGTLSPSSAGDRTTVALNWLRANRASVGLDLATIDRLSAPRRVDGASGLTVLHFRQSDRGVPAFDNEVRVVLDRYNRVLAAGGSPLADPSVASVDPKLSATEALRALQRDVGAVKAIDVSSGPSGATRATRFGGVDRARLVLFGSASGARLAWHVQYQATSVALYDAVVDATSGAILLRQNLTKFASNATIYPNYPGAEGDSHPAKAAAGTPQVVDLTARGYLPLVPAQLSGKNVHAFSDVNDDNVANPGPDEIVPPSSGTNFQYPLTPFGPDPAATNSCTSRGINATCTWSPYADPASWRINRKQNATQAFYLANVWHDWLERPTINFDEASGNFEVGGPGGDDPVILEADDGAATGGDGGPDVDHINNANMSTPVDGDSPRTQMYLFKFDDDPGAFFRFRNVNGGDDPGTVYHEYTHGLSNRLVTNADGSGALSTPHSGAMGEAWSDWYALDFLHRADSATGRPEYELDDPNVVGEVDIGVYSDADFTATRFSPYDCPPGVIAPNCPGGIATGPGGFTLGDFGKVAGAPEVHSDGEIWVQTLWDLRERLVEGFGDEQDGADIAEILVTDAMRVAPPEPSFLDMRNAILAVAQNELNDVGVAAVWEVFAGRGMGFFASVVDGSDVHPVEDFNTPPDPDTPTGTITGRVTSADSGLPLAGAKIGIAGLSTELKAGTSPASLVTTSAADGTYTLEAPAHVYPKVFFKGSAGFDLVALNDVQVTADGETVRNVALRRDWAARGGGGDVTGNDDTGGPFGCGLDQLIDQSLGAGWSPFNPDTTSPEYTGDGSPPTAVVELPQTIDVGAFGLDPSNTCGDDPSATAKDYTLETSPDGTNFTLAKAGSFTLADRNRLNLVTPAGGAKNVRFVRLKLLSPQSDGPGDSGADFIDFSELEVFGGAPNVLPAGTLSATPAAITPGQSVSFTSSFTDADSAITGYDWDFDGNGTVDRSTDTPATSFTYAGAGTFAAKVLAKDFRGGAGTATATVRVTAVSPPPGPPPPPPPPPAKPVISFTASPPRGRLVLRVTCAARCALSGTLKISTADRRKLGLTSRTLRSYKKTITATSRQTITIKLSTRVINAMKRHGLSRLKVSASFTAKYSDRRSTKASRSIRIRR